MIRLAVRCGPDAAEAVLAELLVLAPGGVEQEDGPDWVEYAIYGAPGELPDLGAVQAMSGEQPIEVTSEEIPDDWADRWRDFHEPTAIAGGRVVIRPSWTAAADVEPAAGGLDIVVEPGQAFGTGAHPTTRMSLELLIELADEGGGHGTLVDLGTGSGVLAIAAAKLGWGPVLAVDNELAALDAARENAAANGVELELARVNVREGLPPLAETVVANLTAPLLGEVAGHMRGREDLTPRALVCSGLLARERDEVVAAFCDLELVSTRESGDWAAVRMAPR